MKNTTQTHNGTSFHGVEIKCTLVDLLMILGPPFSHQNDGRDKTNFEWLMETEVGDVFSVYDYKEYRRIEASEVISWHIGGRRGWVTEMALEEISQALTKFHSV